VSGTSGEAAAVPDVAVVVPSVGREALALLLADLAAQDGPASAEVVVVDDRPRPAGPLPGLAALPDVRVVHSCGRGPAAARNAGWRATGARWVAFLDDDVRVGPGWTTDLAADLAAAGPDVGGVQGRLSVPLPADRAPTDVERGTANLATARWITADMAYRRDALVRVHGFDERFPRAYREDSDLAVRVRRAGWGLAVGRRQAVHPVKAGDWRTSLRAQRGNADDALMRRLHGPAWRELAAAGRGRRGRHALTVGSAALAAGAGAVAGVRAATRRGRGGPARAVAVGALLGWAGLTADFAAERIRRGPAAPAEIAAMAVTSAVIPPLALAHWAVAAWRHRRSGAWPDVAAVLFDRDGTLVHDVPYNGDPALVRPVAGARRTLRRLRLRRIRTAVVTNQSGVARGLLIPEEVAAVNATVDALLGPFDSWQVCPHADEDGCPCRKPQPGLVLAAATRLGLSPERCVVIGDTGGDVLAALRAGARAVLVPTAVTRPEEIAAAPVVDLALVGAV
jgi:histidinol-phosphate phosphatase family protein